MSRDFRYTGRFREPPTPEGWLRTHFTPPRIKVIESKPLVCEKHAMRLSIGEKCPFCKDK